MSGGPEPLRLFVAVDLPDAARAAVQAEVAVLARTEAKVRWVPADQLHVTLKFVGDTDPSDLDRLRDALRALPRTGAIQVLLHDLGRFPPPGKGAPRVIWAGLGGEVDRLVALAHSVDGACTALGVARDRRPFSPHLTLGRVKSARGVAPLEELVEARSPQFAVELRPLECFRLYRSELRPEGAVHTVIEEFPLA